MGLRHFHATPQQDRRDLLGASMLVQVPEEVDDLWGALSTSARRQIEEVARQLSGR